MSVVQLDLVDEPMLLFIRGGGLAQACDVHQGCAAAGVDYGCGQATGKRDISGHAAIEGGRNPARGATVVVPEVVGFVFPCDGFPIPRPDQAARASPSAVGGVAGVKGVPPPLVLRREPCCTLGCSSSSRLKRPGHTGAGLEHGLRSH